MSDFNTYDARECGCGEGPLWHAELNTLFWVDIPTCRILYNGEWGCGEITFEEFVSALGIIDKDHLLAATETGLWKIKLNTQERSLIISIEADNPSTRSNDGRADPWGGFWVGTMDKDAAKAKGAIYRYYKNELMEIISGLTIPNGICFDTALNRAYFSDTDEHKIYYYDLNVDDGKPRGDAKLFADFSAEGHSIDGAIIDRNSHMYVGVWDGYAVLKLDRSGKIVKTLDCPVQRPTCPAFGGENNSTLFVTSAAIGLGSEKNNHIKEGQTLIYNLESQQDKIPFVQV